MCVDLYCVHWRTPKTPGPYKNEKRLCEGEKKISSFIKLLPHTRSSSGRQPHIAMTNRTHTHTQSHILVQGIYPLLRFWLPPRLMRYLLCFTIRIVHVCLHGDAGSKKERTRDGGGVWMCAASLLRKLRMLVWLWRGGNRSRGSHVNH